MGVDLTNIAVGLIVLGVVATIGATIVAKIAVTQIVNAGTYSVLNEALTVTNTGVNVANVWGKSIDACANATSSISSGNYTYSVNSDFGTLTLTNTTNVMGSAWTCNYTVYNVSDPRYLVPSKAATGIGEYGNWFKIIVIVGIAAVILALIFMSFRRAGGNPASVGY